MAKKTSKYDVVFEVRQITDGKPEIVVFMFGPTAKGWKYICKYVTHNENGELLFTDTQLAFNTAKMMTGHGLNVRWNEDQAPLCQCKHCDFFIAENPDKDDAIPPLPKFIHLSEPYFKHDHEAEPSEEFHKAAWFRLNRPNLFRTYADNKTGPNSKYHVSYHSQKVAQ
jgi:hypothetical protein